MPSGKRQAKRGVDASALRSIAQVIESEYEKPIEEGHEGWHTINAIAEELGLNNSQARDRVKAMYARGVLERKQARVRASDGRAAKCYVFRVRE